jgi:hypothetical protein
MKKYYSTCTILRTKFVEKYSFSMITGEAKLVSTETVVEEHGTPLFTDGETSTGICASCRKGWEVEGNTFANDEERARATNRTTPRE